MSGFGDMMMDDGFSDEMDYMDYLEDQASECCENNDESSWEEEASSDDGSSGNDDLIENDESDVPF